MSTHWSHMPRQEAQALYDQYGTVYFQRLWNICRSGAKKRMLQLGIRFTRHRIGRCRGTERVYCQRERRECVLHDVDGACDVCRDYANLRYENLRSACEEAAVRT